MLPFTEDIVERLQTGGNTPEQSKALAPHRCDGEPLDAIRVNHESDIELGHRGAGKGVLLTCGEALVLLRSQIPRD